MSADESNKYAELESLRGVAAMLVFLSHIPAWNAAIYNFPLIRHGGLMVDLFFVLSGFIIYKAYGKRINSKKDLARFQIIRFGRLYPVHLLFLTVFLIIEIARQMGEQLTGRPNMNAELLHQNSWSAFLQHIFLVQAILPLGDVLTFNAPSWSIGVEFYTYLLFAIVLLNARKHHIYVFAAMHAVGSAVLVSGVLEEKTWLVRCITGFSLGCLVSHYLANRNMGQYNRWASEALVFLIFIVTYHSALGRNPEILVMWMTALLIVFTIQRREDARPGPIASLFRTNSLVYLGTLSYTLYMSHSAVIWGMNQVARFVLKWPESFVEGSFKPQGEFWHVLILIAATTAVLIAVSACVTKVIENPGRAYFKRKAAEWTR